MDGQRNLAASPGGRRLNLHNGALENLLPKGIARQDISVLHGKTLILGVGAQRSGSSWLHSYLEKNPRVAVSPIKELHFFDSWLDPVRFSRWNNSFEQRLKFILNIKGNTRKAKLHAARVAMTKYHNVYFKYFARLATDQTQFFCEITPSYSTIGQNGLARMRDFLKRAGWNLRIVFVIRDPIDRHWSFTRHKTQVTREPADFIELLSNDNAVICGRYDLLVKDLRAVFDPSELIVTFYENLFSDDDTHLRQIAQQVGIDFMPTVISERVNAAPAAQGALTSKERDAALKVFAPTYDYINQEFGSAKPQSWAK